jgi:hypothetical protein
MKTFSAVVFFLLLSFFSGCVVKSLHPYYHEQDVVFMESLLGSWLDEDSTRWEIKPYIFSKGFMNGDSVDNSYQVELYDEPEEPQRFNAHLFRLNDKLYLDFKPIREDRYDDFLDLHLVSSHSLALLESGEDGSLTIGWFNDEWLDNLFQENRVKISHEVVKGAMGDYGKEYVLTASTDELQKFIRKYGLPGKEGLCIDDDNFLCIHLTKNE